MLVCWEVTRWCQNSLRRSSIDRNKSSKSHFLKPRPPSKYFTHSTQSAFLTYFLGFLLPHPHPQKWLLAKIQICCRWCNRPFCGFCGRSSIRFCWCCGLWAWGLIKHHRISAHFRRQGVWLGLLSGPAIGIGQYAPPNSAWSPPQSTSEEMMAPRRIHRLGRSFRPL